MSPEASAEEKRGPSVDSGTDPAASDVGTPPESTPNAGEEPGKEFNPKGTLALILVYFAIVVSLWFFMYFVEFLGRDLVVIG